MHRALSLRSAVSELLAKLYYVFNSIQDSLHKHVPILLNTLVVYRLSLIYLQLLCHGYM